MKKLSIVKELKDGAVIGLVHANSEITTSKAVVLKKWEFEDPKLHHLLLYLDTNRIVEMVFIESDDPVFKPECASIETLLEDRPESNFQPASERCIIIPDLLKRMLSKKPNVYLHLAAR